MKTEFLIAFGAKGFLSSPKLSEQARLAARLDPKLNIVKKCRARLLTGRRLHPGQLARLKDLHSQREAWR